MKTHNEYAREVYDVFSKRFGAHYRGVGYDRVSWFSKNRLVERMVMFLGRMLPAEKTDLRILDIGCGNGATGYRLLETIKTRLGVGAEINGADFVENNLEIARARYGYSRVFHVDVTNRSILSEFLAGQKYDVLFCCEVLQYIDPDDYDEFFLSARAAIRDEGCFLLIVPNLIGAYKSMYRSLFPQRYKRQFKYRFGGLDVENALIRNRYSIHAKFGGSIVPGIVTEIGSCGGPVGYFCNQFGVVAGNAASSSA